MKKVVSLFFGLALVFTLATTTNAQNAEVKNVECSKEAKLNLPVATGNNDYALYQQITSQDCSQTLIDQGLEFIKNNHDSQLCFAMYQQLVTAAIKLKDYDKAFDLGHKGLEQYPQHTLVMTQLATVASYQMLIGNKKYADEGWTLSRRALSLLKEDTVPSGYMGRDWQQYKGNILGDVYQSLGIFTLLNGCSEEAAEALTRAIEYHTSEPYTYFLLAKAQVQLYKLGVTSPIPTTLNKAGTLAEQIVETYARASLLTEDEKYKPLRTAIEYDINILNKVFPNLKSDLARSVENARNEVNASLQKPAISTTPEP